MPVHEIINVISLKITFSNVYTFTNNTPLPFRGEGSKDFLIEGLNMKFEKEHLMDNFIKIHLPVTNSC